MELPTASLSVEMLLSRTFTAAVSDPGGTEDLTYAWQALLGAGVIASGNEPGFTFTPPDNGAYSIRLVVTDRHAAATTAEINFTVLNRPPLVQFPAGLQIVNEGQVGSWNAGDIVSDASDAQPTVVWELFRITTNGSHEPLGGSPVTASSFSYIFPDNGRYVLRITATDKDGASASAERVIRVENLKPTGTWADVPAEAVAGSPLVLSGTWADVPADSQVAANEDGPATIFASAVLISPGSPAGTPVPVRLANDRTFSLGFLPRVKGTHEVLVTLRDKDGGILTLTHQIEVHAGVVGRHVFYNDSLADGNNTAAGPADDLAIATDKSALLPGQTAGFANYTSFTKGLNGIMIDVAGLADPNGLTAVDFVFKIGNADDPSSWAAAPAPVEIDVREGAGVNGSDRITLIWANGAILGQWLHVEMLATPASGLATPDVFFFGNAPGDTGNDIDGFALVDTADLATTASNQTGFINPATITNIYDFNRDGRVNSFDISVVRRFIDTSSPLRMISLAPLAGASAPEAEVAPPDMMFAESAANDIPESALLFPSPHRDGDAISNPLEGTLLLAADTAPLFFQDTTQTARALIPQGLSAPARAPLPGGRVGFNHISFTPQTADADTAASLRQLASLLGRVGGPDLAPDREDADDASQQPLREMPVLPSISGRDSSLPLLFPEIGNTRGTVAGDAMRTPPAAEADTEADPAHSTQPTAWKRFSRFLSGLNMQL